MFPWQTFLHPENEMGCPFLKLVHSLSFLFTKGHIFQNLYKFIHMKRDNGTNLARMVRKLLHHQLSKHYPSDL